jgi:hypothetical protein
MPPGRNEPCPCGSGRKYKLCCQSADAALEAAAAASATRTSQPGRRELSHRPAILEVIRAVPEWAADIFALPVAVTDGSSPRPVALLVTAGELVVHSDMLGRLRGGAGPVAEALELGVREAARIVGHWPERVVVRHADVADALAPRLASRQTSVRAGEDPGLAVAAKSLLQHMIGESMWPPPSSAELWRGWELADGLVGELFAAAARFYRSAPWTVAGNFQAPRAIMPSGRAWTCSILGQGAEEYGLVLYGDPIDLFERTAGPDLGIFEDVAGPILALTFERLTDLPRTAMREARSHRWEIAGPTAYPRLMTINTAGGGVSAANAQDLLLLLKAVPAWVEAHEPFLEEERESTVPMDAVRWTHEGTGVVFEYGGEGALAGYEGDYDAGAPADLRAELRALVAEVGEEFGPDVDREQLLAEVNRRMGPIVEALNRRPMADLGGLSPDQLHRLLTADWGHDNGVLRLNRKLQAHDVAGAPIVVNARMLLGMGLESGTLPATQSGNLKPALVEELLPRLRWVDAHRAAFSREYHTRTWETDHTELHRLRVVCEQAGLLMRRSARFDLSPRARRLAADEHAGELMAALFVTWFRRFNMAYTTRYEWPELQQQMAYTLVRLPDVARGWRTAGSLLPDVVLPLAVERFVGSAGGRQGAAWALEYLVLDVLAGFGLLERKVEDEYDLAARRLRYRVAPLLAQFVKLVWDDDDADQA